LLTQRRERVELITSRYAAIVYTAQGKTLMERLWKETMQALDADKPEAILAQLSKG
jgi:hypothetical protein